MVNRYPILPVLAFSAILLAIQTTRKRRSHTIDHLIYAEWPLLLEKNGDELIKAHPRFYAHIPNTLKK
jgi:hypothetical protein